MMKNFKQKCNQKGFTLVELMVVIAILGILAAIAIPKFSDSTATANTAKIQADLRTIDAAIVMYQAQEGGNPASDAAGVTELKTKNLLVEVPTPPKGNCFIKNQVAAQAVPSGGYKVEIIDAGSARAILGTYHGSDFKKVTTVET